MIKVKIGLPGRFAFEPGNLDQDQWWLFVLPEHACLFPSRNKLGTFHSLKWVFY